MRNIFLGAGAIIALAGGVMVPGEAVRAQSIVSTSESFMTTDLVTGRSFSDGSREMGLLLRVVPGWKTYWRNPGESGIPPRFDWSGSENLAGVEVLWPRPTIFESFGLTTLGYADEVVLPMRMTPVDPARPIKVRGKLMMGVCKDICVLEETDVAAVTTPDAPGNNPQLIADWLRRVPGDGSAIGVLGAECRISGVGTERAFEAKLKLSHPLSSPMVVLEGPENSWFYETSSAVEDGSIRVTSRLAVIDPATWIGRSDVRITVLSGDEAADIQGCSATAG